jgi:hypothetical protein
MAVPVAQTLILTILSVSLALAAPPDADPVPSPDSADVATIAPGPTPAPPGLRSSSPPDSAASFPKPVMTSIELTPGGVFGSDTLGDWWDYDFDADRFVRGSRIRRAEGGREIARPVEERALNKLEVQPYQSAVTVGYDKYVDGNITAAGRVVVKGWVRGDVQSLSQVLVEPTGQVDGDVKAPEIIVKPGGVVLGEQKISPLSSDLLTWSFTPDGIWIVVGLFLILLFIAFVYTVLAPRQLEHINRCIENYRGKAFLMGLLLLLLLAPLLGVMAITIIGLILVLFTPLAYLVAMSLGLILFGNRVARKTIFRFVAAPPRGFLLSFVGSILVGLFWLAVALLMDSEDAVTYGIGVGTLVLAIPVTFYPVCCGLGAAFLTRFGFRPYVSFHDRQTTGEPGAPAPAPPPIPKAPPTVTPPGRPQVPRRGPSPLSPGND